MLRDALISLSIADSPQPTCLRGYLRPSAASRDVCSVCLRLRPPRYHPHLEQQPVRQTTSSTPVSPSALTQAVKSLGTASNNQSTLLNLDKPSPSPSGTHDALSSIIRNSSGRRAANAEQKKEKTLEGLRARTTSDSYARQMPRFWKAGDVYAPHDLSPAQMRKWRSRAAPKKDVMDLLGVNPLDLYKVCLSPPTSGIADG